jgi:hypothetical protein
MKARATFLAALLVPIFSSPAVEVTLVYQNPSDSFFSVTARNTLEKAAADVSFAITTTLAGLSQDVYVGTSGGTTATANWSLNYIDPTDGTSVVSLETFSLLPDQITIYVGSRVLADDTLGEGGTGGAGLGLSGSGATAGWQAAVDSMENASNTGMVRGGPVLNTISGSISLSGTPASYQLERGYAVSSLSLDSSAAWNLDYALMPTAGQNDLYSVAVHEMLHGIGFGAGQAWDNEADGQNWSGSAVFALLGTGTNVLSEDGKHIAEGLTGVPLIDGVWQFGAEQEALMDPSILQGTRKYITDLDLAFLQDLGWETQVVPEPAAGMLVLAAGVVFLGRRHRRGAGGSGR